MNEPKFEAGRYRAYRPLYPATIYAPLARRLEENPQGVFLDLACGAGQSTLSFSSLGFAARGYSVDRDPAMIEEARKFLVGHTPVPIDLRVGSAEAIPIEDDAVDLVLIGSAIHWFPIARAKTEIERVLKPGGFLYVYEYQFPKCREDGGLNELIRRKFNTEWKAPNQTPRGTLAELLAPFTTDSTCWKEREESRPEWIETLSLEAFLGNLFSQSRYLHAELAQKNPLHYQEEVADAIRPHFAHGPLTFDFKPRTFLFRFV
jgi:ubiquinone/menaquinone biosynthesis C-methylase UbiE